MDDLDWEDLVTPKETCIPQGISSSEVLGSGVVFDVTDPEPEEQDHEAGQQTYFKGLAKLSADGCSISSYCQGMDDDLDDGTIPPFVSLRARMTDLVGDGGVMKVVHTPGSGSQIPPGSRAQIHYVGQFEDFDEPFDSTYLRGKGRPEMHLVGPASQLIPGLNMTILSMKKGEEALALVRPEYAYGSMGCGPRIPGGAEALFRVLLISWTDSTEVDEFNSLSEEERNKASFDKKLQAIRCCHLNGNENYKRKDYSAASRDYREAINIFLDNMVFKDEQEHDKAKEVIVKVMSNRTQALLSCNQWKDAAKQGRMALRFLEYLQPISKYTLFLRLAKAMIYLMEFDEVQSLLSRARKINPQGNDLKRITELFAQRAKSQKLHDIEFSRRIFQSASSQRSSDKPLVSEEAGAPNNAGADPAHLAGMEDYDPSLVTEEYREDVEQMLTSLLEDAHRHELPLPVDRTEEGSHKLMHLRIRCQHLGLEFVEPTKSKGARVCKRQ